MKFLFLALLFSLSLNNALAEASKESVKELIAIAQIDKTTQMMFEPIIDGIVKNLEEFKASYLANNKTNNSQKALLVKRINDFKQDIRNDLKWEALAPMYERIYSELLTQDDVNGVIAFYKSPAGQAWVKKTPAVFEKAKQEGEVLMLTITQKLQANIQTLQTDLTKLDVK